jgi:hypothetical protein
VECDLHNLDARQAIDGGQEIECHRVLATLWVVGRTQGSMVAYVIRIFIQWISSSYNVLEFISAKVKLFLAVPEAALV